MSRIFPTPTEAGFPIRSPAPSPFGAPPGMGRYTVPNYLTFAGIIQLLSRTYRWRFDEALREGFTNYLAMRRDVVLMDALRARQYPTAQLSWHLEPQDRSDPEQRRAASLMTTIIEATPNLQKLKFALLEAIWYGRYAVNLVYEWDYSAGFRRLVCRDHMPVNGDKLIAKWDGRWGVLTHWTYPGAVEVTDRGRAHFLSPEERETWIVHEHENDDADYMQGELAGQIRGVGIRSRLYWYWWMREEVRSWMLDYLQRVGAGGLTVFYYEQGNDAALQAQRQNAEDMVRNNIIFVPRPPAVAGGTTDKWVERIEPSQAGTQILMSLIDDYFDAAMRRYVLGQSLSSGTAATGMGSGVAEAHMTTLARIIKFDAVNLQETMSRDFVRVLQKYNCPQVPPLRMVFEVDKPEVKDFAQAVELAHELGLELDADEVRGSLGLSKPRPGNETIPGGQAPMAGGAEQPGGEADDTALNGEAEAEQQAQPEDLTTQFNRHMHAAGLAPRANGSRLKMQRKRGDEQRCRGGDRQDDACLELLADESTVREAVGLLAAAGVTGREAAEAIRGAADTLKRERVA